MTNCTVCNHPQREAVEKATNDKSSLRRIATLFGLSKDAVRRHWKHMPVEADPLLLPIPQCPTHGRAPFRFVSGTWICSYCDTSWDGSLAYFRYADETMAQETKA